MERSAPLYDFKAFGTAIIGERNASGKPNVNKTPPFLYEADTPDGYNESENQEVYFI